jgi:hypothetical protein
MRYAADNLWISGLNTKLQRASFAYFGVKALGTIQIPGN